MLEWIKNCSVVVKVSIAPAVAVVCLALMAVIGWTANAQLGGTLETLTDVRLPRIALVASLDQQLASLNASVYQSLAWEGAGFKAERIDTLDKQIAQRLKTYDGEIAALVRNPGLDSKEREVAQALMTDFAKYQKSSLDTLDIKSGMLSNAATFMTVIDGHYLRLRDGFDKLTAHERALSQTLAADAGELRTRNYRTILTGFVVAVGLAAALALLCARLIVVPLREAANLAAHMSTGDFTHRPIAPARDATGRVLNALGEVSMRLSDIVSTIRDASLEVNTASEEIANGNDDLSSRTERTAATLQQAAATMETLTGTVRQSARNADDASTRAKEATDVADRGTQAMQLVTGTMQQIDRQARRIGEIVGVIDSIAFQTNILALNAAVEAARAGEDGRGFGVVAQEVRTLAKRSADASKEIRQLVVASVAQVESGSREVDAAGTIIQRVRDAIYGVSAMMQEISTSATAQADTIERVNTTIVDMDHNTQQNAALVEQAAAAAAMLRDQARRLTESIQSLRTL